MSIGRGARETGTLYAPSCVRPKPAPVKAGFDLASFELLLV